MVQTAQPKVIVVHELPAKLRAALLNGIIQCYIWYDTFCQMRRESEEFEYRMRLHAFMAVFLSLLLLGGFSIRRPPTDFVDPHFLYTHDGEFTPYARYQLGPKLADVVLHDALVNPGIRTLFRTPHPKGEPKTYTVQPGDTLWEIGARFDVGIYSVLWSNGLDNTDVSPGQELLIPPLPGVVHPVSREDTLDGLAKKYNVDPAVIVDFNGIEPGTPLSAAQWLIIPGGELPVLPKITLPGRIQPPPIPVRPAAPSPPPPATGRFSWPTRGIITTFFALWHPGIDIAAPYGTPVGAADAGVVTFAGWNSTGYGYRVVVNHGNGYTTTYNHLSQIQVRVGDGLSKGGRVGLVGSSGRSTGPHLHFEVIRGNQYLNPMAILG